MKGKDNGSNRQPSASPYGYPAQQPGAGRYTGPTTVTIQSQYGTLVPYPVPIPNAGISAGEIIGYRAWRWQDDGLLHSMFVRDYVWHPRRIENVDKTQLLHLGLHAFKKMKYCKAEYDYFGSGDFSTIIIFGKVEMWGEVIEHELGYRAEYAKIVELEHPSIWGKFLGGGYYGFTKYFKRLCELYGVSSC